MITYELSLRFLTDFLQGDTCFKVKRAGHNFERARAQFQLLRSMQEHASVMEMQFPHPSPREPAEFFPPVLKPSGFFRPVILP